LPAAAIRRVIHDSLDLMLLELGSFLNLYKTPSQIELARPWECLRARCAA
jgi:hypothetical protein